MKSIFEIGKTYDVKFLGVQRTQRIRVSAVDDSMIKYVRVRKSDGVSFGWTREMLGIFIQSSSEYKEEQA